MKKTFKLDGLDCANCAAKMEANIGKLAGVQSASVNFMTTKLIIEADDDKMDDIIKSAEAIIKKLEPDVEMRNA